jgi:hypothetical protein
MLELATGATTGTPESAVAAGRRGAGALRRDSPDRWDIARPEPENRPSRAGRHRQPQYLLTHYINFRVF